MCSNTIVKILCKCHQASLVSSPSVCVYKFEFSPLVPICLQLWSPDIFEYSEPLLLGHLTSDIFEYSEQLLLGLLMENFPSNVCSNIEN